MKWGRSEALGADARGCLRRQGCRRGCRWCDHGGVDDAVAMDEDAGGPDAADAGAVDDGDGGASAAGVGRPALAAKKVSARRPSASRTAVCSSSECIENEDNRVQSYSLKCNPRILVSVSSLFEFSTSSILAAIISANFLDAELDEFQGA